jgi:methylmalonyl-CoA mutase, N-terminal domain
MNLQSFANNTHRKRSAATECKEAKKLKTGEAQLEWLQCSIDIGGEYLLHSHDGGHHSHRSSCLNPALLLPIVNRYLNGVALTWPNAHVIRVTRARRLFGRQSILTKMSADTNSPRSQWEAAFNASPTRDAEFSTLSGIPLDPVYGPEDGDFPGQYPYTRGPYASMYRSRLWTMRMFAGFGTAEDTNWRFKEIIKAGGNGLSTAFDMPTLLGLDSDDPMSLGEVGRCGVAVDSLSDMEDLYAGIDLGEVTTSMTINSPAAVIFSMFIAQAEKAGVPRARLGGTLQNDILKEYQAQKEFVFPPRQSMRLVRDTIDFTAAEMPRWHSVSISGYHIREAGSTAVEELAFTLANGFAYVELALAAGLDVDAFAPRLSFFFNAHIDFFEEIAKYRAARRIWARWMKERYGATDPRSMQCRFHTQTAGVSLTAQQPEVNIARTAIEALAGVLGGTQSLHTNSMDEALALPTEKAARIALRTQQVIAHETNVAHVADPLGGSYYVESLTDEVERQAEEIFAHLESLGNGSLLEGVITGIEENWFQGRISDSAYDLERRLNAGQRITVGVNGFQDGNEEDQIQLLRITNEDEQRQRKRLDSVRSDRSQEAVDAALEKLRTEAEDPEINLMPTLIEASRAYATVGEMMSTMAGVFGRHVEVPSI